MTFVYQVVVAGLTDVWSAIRTSCATRLYSLLETFRLPDLEILFARLASICGDGAASWQAKEGAVLGIAWAAALYEDPSVARRALLRARHERLAQDLGEDSVKARHSIDEWINDVLAPAAFPMGAD